MREGAIVTPMGIQIVPFILLNPQSFRSLKFTTIILITARIIPLIPIMDIHTQIIILTLIIPLTPITSIPMDPIPGFILGDIMFIHKGVFLPRLPTELFVPTLQITLLLIPLPRLKKNDVLSKKIVPLSGSSFHWICV